jgi:hypothetical protein
MPYQHNIPDGFDTRGKAVGRPEASPMAGRRIDSVDALRGLTILLMVFVNDLGPAAPAWMHHIQPPNADGMTLADIVFPAFLFLVGVSIPLAFERAQAAGKSKLTQLVHVLTRTAGLLLMGVIELNRLARPDARQIVVTCAGLYRVDPDVVCCAARAGPEAEPSVGCQDARHCGPAGLAGGLPARVSKLRIFDIRRQTFRLRPRLGPWNVATGGAKRNPW